MGFSIAIELEAQQQEQETKFLSSSLNIMASSSIKSTNSTTQLEPLPPHLHHQQPPHHFHHHQIPDQQISFGMMPSSSSPSIPANYLSKDSGAYDLGELDQAFFLYLDGQADPSSVQDQRQNSSSGMRPPPTLNIFPSQPMHAVPPSNSKVSMELPSKQTNGSKRPPEPSIAKPNPHTETPSAAEPSKAVKREGNRKGTTSSSEQEAPKTPDPKTLRRLAQNREAARKSRLRKKAYVQQLESSRIKLNQLEQELQRARAQVRKNLFSTAKT